MAFSSFKTVHPDVQPQWSYTIVEHSPKIAWDHMRSHIASVPKVSFLLTYKSQDICTSSTFNTLHKPKARKAHLHQNVDNTSFTSQSFFYFKHQRDVSPWLLHIQWKRLASSTADDVWSLFFYNARIWWLFFGSFSHFQLVFWRLIVRARWYRIYLQCVS